MQANKRRYEFANIDLIELTNEIMDSYEFHLSNKGFQLETNIPDKNEIVYGDREAIAETIINLIDNALKYSVEEKKIEVSVVSDQNNVSISIKDHGIGIPKSYQKDVFDQFFRVPTNNIHNAKGSGLGLSLVKHIMDAHHGQIKLDSTPGKGSTFTLVFPIKKTTT